LSAPKGRNRGDAKFSASRCGVQLRCGGGGPGAEVFPAPETAKATLRAAFNAQGGAFSSGILPALADTGSQKGGKMKPLVSFLLFAFSFSAAAEHFDIEVIPTAAPTAQMNIMSCNPDPGQCKIVDQDGSSEPWDCRDSKTGTIRCYADVEYENGTKLRIWGGCYGSYSDCWWSGPGHVDACD
jgi:hypothetical protein